MRPWQVHAGRRGAGRSGGFGSGPRRQVRVLGPQAERAVRPDPVDYPHEVLPIAPSPTLARARTISRREPPEPSYLGVSGPGGSPGAVLGLRAALAAAAPSAFGVILWNCLFMDLSRNTSATAMTANTTNPSSPGVTLSLARAAAASTPNVKGTPSPGRPRTGHPRATRYPRRT